MKALDDLIAYCVRRDLLRDEEIATLKARGLYGRNRNDEDENEDDGRFWSDLDDANRWRGDADLLLEDPTEAVEDVRTRPGKAKRERPHHVVWHRAERLGDRVAANLELIRDELDRLPRLFDRTDKWPGIVDTLTRPGSQPVELEVAAALARSPHNLGWILAVMQLDPLRVATPEVDVAQEVRTMLDGIRRGRALAASEKWILDIDALAEVATLHGLQAWLARGLIHLSIHDEGRIGAALDRAFDMNAFGFLVMVRQARSGEAGWGFPGDVELAAGLYDREYDVGGSGGALAVRLDRPAALLTVRRVVATLPFQGAVTTYPAVPIPLCAPATWHPYREAA